METAAGRIRPMEVGEIFGEALELYKNNAALFMGVVALALIPAAILAALSPATAILSTLLSDAAIGALIFAIAQRYLGRSCGVTEPYETIGVSRFVSLIVAQFLYGLAVVIGLLLLIIPGIYLAIKWAFVGQAIVIEGTGIGGAFSRSSELTRGEMGRVLVVGLLIILTSLLVGVVLAIVSAPLGRLVAGAIGPLINIVLFPFTYGVATMLYYDLRHRKEGFVDTPGVGTSPVTP